MSGNRGRPAARRGRSARQLDQPASQQGSRSEVVNGSVSAPSDLLVLVCPVCHKQATVDCVRVPQMCVTCCVYNQNADRVVCTGLTHLVHEREPPEQLGEPIPANLNRGGVRGDPPRQHASIDLSRA
ncbi:MAG: hypothetical protein ACREHG_02970, partial [Candidatus Saccharimonadales bacterium]